MRAAPARLPGRLTRWLTARPPAGPLCGRLTVAALLVVVLAGSVGTTPVDAQRRRRGADILRVSPRLSMVTALTCTFPVAAGGAWPDGQPRAEVTKVDTFTLKFFQVDAADATANAVGLGDTSEVIVRLVGDNLHFLDVRQNGAIALTTVFDQETRDGRLKAVHSRSEFFGSTGVPGQSPQASQWYGDCAQGAR